MTSDSVCRLIHSVSFEDFSIEQVFDQIQITDNSTCGRKTTYFGDLPYYYGDVYHSPCPYPKCELFDSMFERIKSTVDPDFTQSNYTCLVTYYRDGNAYIPSHSDDEKLIMPDSTIFTLSVGAPRTLRLINFDGLIHETDVVLPHGSLYSMSSTSQLSWAHSIARDPSITEPRVSFTFRRIMAEPREEPRKRVPPIKPPEPVKPSIACGSHRRILLLTDSVLIHTPERIFDGWVRGTTDA